MREEIIISGRNNPAVDPFLNIWHWEIPLYLFLGGLAAGILIFAAIYTINGKRDEYPTVTKWAPLLVPFLLIIGLLVLFIDLRHKLFFWRLYTIIRLESPMSWGAWTLLVVTPLSIIWSGIHLKELFPKINWRNKFAKYLKVILKPYQTDEKLNWEWKYKFLQTGEKFFIKHIKKTAWIMLIYAVILGIYTGILLSAFNARPLWNTSILGMLFLASGLSAATAVIMLMTKNPTERKMFTIIDLMIIGTELFLIIHMFMGFFASTQVQIDAANLFIGGPYTMIFWILVVFLGLLLPAFLEILELKGKHIPAIIPPIMILFGGIIFRFVMVYAGQISKYHH